MRLLDITATAHHYGNRIDLAWHYPVNLAKSFGVRVMRGERSYPAHPDEGVCVAQEVGLTSVQDHLLKGETVYYYSLFPFTGDPPQYHLDAHNRTIAMAISPYGFADLLYSMLPEIARRYDAETTARPGTVASAHRDQGQLRRFLDLPGSELDRLYSCARAVLSFANPERVDGRLLPLLAQWIGWHTDHRLSLDAQRNEIRAAPRIYQGIGGAPALDAMATRVTGWTNRTKEFVHNVAQTNRPELLNLWSAVRDSAEAWTEPALTSVNYAYDGRPAAVREPDGSVLFIYHTRRGHSWDIWAKRYADGQWQPSVPVVDRPCLDRNPAAAPQGNRLWLFWQGYDSAEPAPDRRWRIWYTRRNGAVWAKPEVFGDRKHNRRMPAAVADDAGGVWLFWLEDADGAQRLRYNRHDGAAWQLAVPGTVPLDDDSEARAEEDLFVLFHPEAGTPRLWLFWAQQEAGEGPGQTRWHVVYRTKQGLDPASDDWSPLLRLPRDTDKHHDRQPAALLSANSTDGAVDIELFWSSTRDGGWSVYHSTVTVGTGVWGAAESVVSGPYTCRAPLAVTIDGQTLLLYRSNESPKYPSVMFGATHTVDHRYAGTTTVDTRALAKRHLYGTFGDFQTYTHSTGTGGIRTDAHRIAARDTIGLFLSPGTDSQEQIRASVTRLAGVVREFTPVTTRPVFIME
ncbi:hypothetical protein ABZ318_38015 [Streptomyces sp. NPDC006197]|uniref:hypothetical protein n=1 Tax=Streptomyces sp. NPDC006197 TaxID=3156685 RepID=UPI0033BB0FC4